MPKGGGLEMRVRVSRVFPSESENALWEGPLTPTLALAPFFRLIKYCPHPRRGSAS